jgi:hypothetical protein
MPEKKVLSVIQIWKNLVRLAILNVIGIWPPSAEVQLPFKKIRFEAKMREDKM